MPKEADLILALEFVTEGANAVVPQELHRSAFGLESFQMASSRPVAMALYVGGSVVAGLLAVWAGHALGSR